MLPQPITIMSAYGWVFEDLVLRQLAVGDELLEVLDGQLGSARPGWVGDVHVVETESLAAKNNGTYINTQISTYLPSSGRYSVFS